MALPKLDNPWYPFPHEPKIKFRGFTVKEQKIILQAKQSESMQSQIEAISQIISLCSQGKKTDKLPIHIALMLMLFIRGKSVGEDIDLVHRYEDDEGKTQEVKFVVSINEVSIKTFDDHKDKFPLTDTIGICMKAPLLKDMSSMETEGDMTEMLIKCIDYVYDSNEIYPFSENSPEDKIAFIEDINQTGYQNIKHFFETLPQIYAEKEIELHDGTKKKIELKGFQDFF